MATQTTGFAHDRPNTATQDSPGTRFLSEAVTASTLLDAHRAQVRERALQREEETSLSLRQFMQRAERGLPAEKRDQPPPPSAVGGEDSETDDEGWERSERPDVDEGR